MRILSTGVVLSAGFALLAADNTPLPHVIEWGPLTLAPSGFVESIGVVRSQTTHDDISTRFGSVPLGTTPGESLVSMGHSRIQAEGHWGRWSAWYESDFLQRAPAQPYRIRQFYGTVRLGDWELSAGREYSLLRPNRKGINSQVDLMNTRVVDPAYHVGLAGKRNQQARAVRHMGDWHVAVTFEDGKNGLVKLAHDSARLHWEAVGMAGSAGHHGVSAAAVWHAAPHVDVVTQQFLGKGAGYDALGTAPLGVPAFSTLQGIETALGKWQAYGYAGLVYAGRSGSNRTVSEWTAGGGRELIRDPAGRLLIGVQFSRLSRDVWTGAQGRQNLLMISLRQYFGGAR